MVVSGLTSDKHDIVVIVTIKIAPTAMRVIHTCSVPRVDELRCFFKRAFSCKAKWRHRYMQCTREIAVCTHKVGVSIVWLLRCWAPSGCEVGCSPADYPCFRWPSGCVRTSTDDGRSYAVSLSSSRHWTRQHSRVTADTAVSQSPSSSHLVVLVVVVQ
jgi:hypothetical protein